MMDVDYIECDNNVHFLKRLPDESIDLVVTSPPYDNLRTYNGYSFEFDDLAQQLYRIVKVGGVVVWIVDDATVNGSRTGSSFRQALFFKDIGFNLHDVMIWNKGSFTATGSLQIRYAPVYEYMMILSKGKPKTFNPIKDRINLMAGTKSTGKIRLPDGSFRAKSTYGNVYGIHGQRFNIMSLWLGNLICRYEE